MKTSPQTQLIEEALREAAWKALRSVKVTTAACDAVLASNAVAASASR